MSARARPFMLRRPATARKCAMPDADDDLILDEDNPAPLPEPADYTWKLLVVDDEPDVRAVTRLGLRNFSFAGRPLEFIEAGSCAEAQEQLARHPDIAVALIDVVMETDDAGLRLVETIRKQLDNQLIRLVIRTGQPGAAPERYVIDHFDIDDYKDKTELTTTRLYTTVRSALKAYRDLCAIDINRLGLERLLQAAPEIYRLANMSLQQFLSGILTQIVGLCHLSPGSFISTVEGIVATVENSNGAVHAATGHYLEPEHFQQIHALCWEALCAGREPEGLPANALVVPIRIGEQPEGYIYVEPTLPLGEDDRRLIRLTAHQCAQALDNLRLHIDLNHAYHDAVDMLARIAEYKDETTGSHIERIARDVEAVALAMGLSTAEAEAIASASRLHDVGKVAIPDELLTKPGALDEQERGQMRAHPDISARILEPGAGMGLAREIARHHHEHWAGGGYPEGRPASEMSLAVRIVSLVDVFDALVSPRPYKKAWPVAQARAEIVAGSGKQFDPAVVSAFLRLLDSGAFAPLIEAANGKPA